MIQEDLKVLQNHEGDPCVSIIIPTHRVSTETDKDYIRLKNAIKRAIESLHEQYAKKQVSPIIQRLEAIMEDELDYSTLLEGIGVFISPSIEKVVHLPFEVDEKVIVDTNFEVRDLKLALNRDLDYQVLILSESNIRLFYGKGRNIVEYKDGQLPLKLDKETSEYQKANFINPGTASPGGSTEKANEEQKKIIENLKYWDNKLTSYFDHDTPLFIAGDKQILGDFEQITHHKDKIQGKLTGNFDHLRNHEIADKIQTEVKRYIHELQERAIRILEEEVGFDRVSSGLPKVFEDALKGKGSLLLVEESYSEPGYLDEKNYRLYLEPDKTDGLKRLEDAVDDVIEEVLNKNGEVRFVADGKLQKYGRIALILRYSQ